MKYRFLFFLLVLSVSFCFSHGQMSLARESKAEKEKATLALRQLLGKLYRLEVSSLASSGPAAENDSALAQQVNVLFASIGQRLSDKAAASIQTKLNTLQTELKKSEKPASAMQPLLSSLRQELWKAFEVDAAPALSPDLNLAKKAYEVHCQSCHGLQGKGDGVLAKKLPRAMHSFWEEEYWQNYAPLMILNVLLDGVEASPMPGFKNELTNRELWSLSYYLLSFAWQEKGGFAPLTSQEKTDLLKHGLSLQLLAQKSNRELLLWLRNEKLCLGQRCEEMLGLLRSTVPFKERLSRYGEAKLKQKAQF